MPTYSLEDSFYGSEVNPATFKGAKSRRPVELVVYPDGTARYEYVSSEVQPNSSGQLEKSDARMIQKAKDDERINNAFNTKGLVKDAASMLPIVGDAIDVYDGITALKNKDYLTAGMIGGGFLLPNILEKPIRLGFRYIKNGYRKFARNIQNIGETAILRNRLKHDTQYDIIVNKQNNSLKELEENPLYYDTLSRSEIKDNVSKNMNNHFRDNSYYDFNIDNFDANTKRNFIKYQQEFQEYPAYNYYAAINDLNPNDPNTVKKFIKNQGYSIRGVYTKSDKEDYIKYLKEANNDFNPDRRGADMFTSRGLYTSNSNKVSDKFDKAIHDPNTKGYTAKVFRDFDIDESLPVKEQLQQLQDRILEYDIIHAIEDNNKFIKYDELRMAHPEIYAWEGPYFVDPHNRTPTVKQRAYVNSSDVFSKPVVDIVDLSQTGFGGVRKNRFGINNSPTADLFISQYPFPNDHNIDRYTDLINTFQSKNHNDNYYIMRNMISEKTYNDIIKNNISKLRSDKAIKLHRKANDKTRDRISLTQIGAVGGSLVLGITSGALLSTADMNNKLSKEQINEWNKMSDEQFEKEYNGITNAKDSYKDDFINLLEYYKKEREAKLNSNK